MRRLILFVLLLAALVTGATLGAAGQSGLTIVRSEASYTFQKEVRFVLEASGENDIVKATVRFRLADQTATNVTEKTVEPARSVKVEHTWNVSNNDLPTGVTITYWWTVEDKAGNRLDSQRRSFLYEDTTHTWRKLSRDDITLAWYRGDDALGRDLLDAAATAYNRLAADFGVERKPARIYIYGSYEDLRSGIGESAREWTGGRAYPEFGVMLIGVPPGQGEFGRRAVVHEFSHLIVHRATQNPFGGLPRWLDEGLAMWAEGPLESSYKNALNQAVRTNRLLSLKTLSSNFPADPAQASLAYAESYSVVTFILDTYGREKLAELLRVYKEGTADDDALQRVLGTNTAGLEERWRASLGVSSGLPQGSIVPAGRRPLPANLATLIVVGLMCGALIVLAGLVLVVALLTRPTQRT